MQDICIFAGTKSLRQVDFRVDRSGIYFNFYQQGLLVAGISFQFPGWLTKSYYTESGFNAFSWNFEEVHERETAIKVERLPDGSYLTYNPYHIYTFDMHYSADGTYLGQYQDDAYDGGRLYLSAEKVDGKPCVNGKPVQPLTAELRSTAEPSSPIWYKQREKHGF